MLPVHFYHNLCGKNLSKCNFTRLNTLSQTLIHLLNVYLNNKMQDKHTVNTIMTVQANNVKHFLWIMYHKNIISNQKYLLLSFLSFHDCIWSCLACIRDEISCYSSLHVGCLGVCTAIKSIIIGVFIAVLVVVFLSPLLIRSPCLSDKLPPKPSLVGHRGAPMVSTAFY